MTRAERIAVLLGTGGSRCNKMHLAAGWGFEWRWAGDGPTSDGTMRSRMQFRIGEVWLTARSWDEDVRPTLVTNSGRAASSPHGSA